jgi:hypothetical protein
MPSKSRQGRVRARKRGVDATSEQREDARNPQLGHDLSVLRSPIHHLKHGKTRYICKPFLRLSGSPRSARARGVDVTHQTIRHRRRIAAGPPGNEGPPPTAGPEATLGKDGEGGRVRRCSRRVPWGDLPPAGSTVLHAQPRLRFAGLSCGALPMYWSREGPSHPRKTFRAQTCPTPPLDPLHRQASQGWLRHPGPPLDCRAAPSRSRGFGCPLDHFPAGQHQCNHQSTNGSADAGTAGGSSVESGMFS